MKRFPPPYAGNWLYAGIALVIAPHAMHLPMWLSLLAFAAIAWRWLADHTSLPIPGKWLRGLMAIAACAGIVAEFHTMLGRDAGVALLSLMLGMKMLETSTYRDAMLGVFLGFFVLVTNFFYSQSIPLALYLLVVMLVLTTALVCFHHRVPQDWKIYARRASVLVAQAVPLMLLLFVLFPRIQGPLWGLPGDAFAGRTGLSDDLTPGSISRLVQSYEVAFRAEFSGPVPANPDLYWRALVMDEFDGRSWHASKTLQAYRGMETSTVSPVPYILTIEPNDKPWLFALETLDAESLPPNTRLTADLRLLANNPLRVRTRFQLASRIGENHRVPRDDAEISRALHLPRQGNPRTRELAMQLKAQSASPSEIAERALDFIRQQGFVYTLNPPLLGRDSADELLFKTRQGFCEHYAAAFAFLMRAAGVPARIVTGYLGGEYNRTGNYLVVRQSDAHAWTEIWLDGKGWVRVDPTAAVSTMRIEDGIDASLGADEPLPFLLRNDLRWLKLLQQQWDAINNQWNQWVIDYDQESQISLFAKLGFGILDWQDLARYLSIGMGILLAILAAFVFRNRQNATDPALKLYNTYCAKLARAGLPRFDNEGPQDYAKRIIAAKPQLVEDVEAITLIYIQLRYAPVDDKRITQLKELASTVKRFKAAA